MPNSLILNTLRKHYPALSMPSTQVRTYQLSLEPPNLLNHEDSLVKMFAKLVKLLRTVPHRYVLSILEVMANAGTS